MSFALRIRLFEPQSAPVLALADCIQLLWAPLIAQLVKNLPAMQETQVQLLGLEDNLKKG